MTDHPALIDDHESISRATLDERVERVGSALVARRVRALGLLADNGVPWVTVDRAASRASVPLVPLPGFFTDAQLRSVIERVGLDRLATDDPARVERFPGARRARPIAGLAVFEFPGEAELPAGAVKVTFTSGTTGHPKGVVLGRETLESVAGATARATGGGPDERHFCIHSLSILLENIAGVDRTLLRRGSVILRSVESRGVHGACGLDPKRLLTALRKDRATSCILTPAFLEELTARLARRPEERPGLLRFVGVGGARTPVAVLQTAASLGVSVFEGYGLSEAGSVLTLNTDGDRALGSVGRPIEGIELKIAANGEVLVRGRRAIGYLGEPFSASADGFWATGDFGRLDPQGRLFLEGRTNDVICTPHGRNVSPRWVEQVLLDSRVLRSARVHELPGVGLVAVVRPAPRRDRDVADAVRRANRLLPDYARVNQWVMEGAPIRSVRRDSEDSSCSTTA